MLEIGLSRRATSNRPRIFNVRFFPHFHLTFARFFRQRRPQLSSFQKKRPPRAHYNSRASVTPPTSEEYIWNRRRGGGSHYRTVDRSISLHTCCATFESPCMMMNNERASRPASENKKNEKYLSPDRASARHVASRRIHYQSRWRAQRRRN